MLKARPPRERRRTHRTQPPGVMPRSPAEALEPTRAPSRPKGSRTRREVRRLGPTLRFVNALLTFSFLALAVAAGGVFWVSSERSEEHTSELQSRPHLVCRLLL